MASKLRFDTDILVMSSLDRKGKVQMRDMQVQNKYINRHRLFKRSPDSTISSGQETPFAKKNSFSQTLLYKKPAGIQHLPEFNN